MQVHDTEVIVTTRARKSLSRVAWRIDQPTISRGPFEERIEVGGQ